MDLITQTIRMRCRAAILRAERDSKRIRSTFKNYRGTESDTQSAMEMRAFRLGVQFKQLNHDPFIDWNHPLSKELSKSFLMGAGQRHSSAA